MSKVRYIHLRGAVGGAILRLDTNLVELGVPGEIVACFVVIGSIVFFLAGNHK